MRDRLAAQATREVELDGRTRAPLAHAPRTRQVDAAPQLKAGLPFRQDVPDRCADLRHDVDHGRAGRRAAREAPRVAATQHDERLEAHLRVPADRILRVDTRQFVRSPLRELAERLGLGAEDYARTERNAVPRTLSSLDEAYADTNPAFADTDIYGEARLDALRSDEQVAALPSRDRP